VREIGETEGDLEKLMEVVIAHAFDDVSTNLPYQFVLPVISFSICCYICAIASLCLELNGF